MKNPNKVGISQLDNNLMILSKLLLGEIDIGNDLINRDHIQMIFILIKASKEHFHNNSEEFTISSEEEMKKNR